jgi:tRNA dimethylallyltransferase
MSRPLVIFVSGPTASGKTAAAISLAKTLKAEIISFDSRQFYRELKIGAAPPSTDQLAEVQHHFIGHLSVAQDYTVSQFEKDVLQLISARPEKHLWVAVGGSGLFMRVLTEGLDEMPNIPTEIRAQAKNMLEQQGIEALQQYVEKHDPAYSANVDRQNHRRLLRAVELHLATGLPYSHFRKEEQKARPFDFLKLIADVPREQLYENINQRVDEMMDAGLLEECRELLPFAAHNALRTVGYKEIFAHLNGEIELKEAVALIKQNTRRYAKRQLTWFRKEANTIWLTAAEIAKLDEQKIASLLNKQSRSN